MPAHPYARTRGVRYNHREQQFEMWCPACVEKHGSETFWPLTTEFWDIHTGLSACRACRLELKRAAEKGRRAKNREAMLAYNRAYYAENRELLRWKDNQRKAARRAATTEVSAEGTQDAVQSGHNPDSRGHSRPRPHARVREVR